MRKQRLLIPVLVLAAAGLAAFGGRALASLPPALPPAPPSAAARLASAWQNARTAGKYSYGIDITQTTHPTARYENQGLSSKRETYRIEGANDLPAQSLTMKIWKGEGSVNAASEALEMKVVDGKALGRNGSGAWRELDASSNLFAPDNDPLAYMTAARDVTVLGTASRNGVRYTRYAFGVDGVAFAEYMRGRMDDELRRKGKLPPNMNLGVLRQYVDMSGSGEVWVSDAGLPLRQVVQLQFPPQGLEWIDAEISTDFSDWDESRLALGVPPADASLPEQAGDLAARLGAVIAAEGGRALTLAASALALAAFLILLTRFATSRRVYRAVVFSVVAAMLCGPLLQTGQAAAFVDDQRGQQAKADEQKAATAQQEKGLAALNASDFSPNLSPLALADQRAGADRQLAAARGERDTLLAAPVAESTPSPLDAVAYVGCTKTGDEADPDGDGLTNVQEEAIGTDPCEYDSDSDDIPDGAEVAGFEFSGKRFYLDPRNIDSDGDGTPDGPECGNPDLLLENGKTAWAPTDPKSPLNLMKRQSTGGGLSCIDTDGDGVPDVWDDDSDGDGVPDTLDLASTTVVAGAFNGNGVIGGFVDQTFKLSVTNPSPGKPLVVEFQLRPANPDHLYLRQNVLDWAKDDRKGQVQSVNSPTYGASGRDANGNMRLTPMLEIQITLNDGHGNGLPVKPGFSGAIGPLTPLQNWLDTDTLDSFGISVKRKDQDGSLVAYSPLNLVRDTVGSKPVAFSATMFYRPGGNTFGTHKVRLAWLVQALTDVCDTRAATEKDAYDKWCAGTTHWVTNGSQTVHAYYDDWYLTGLSVREDGGMRVGALFENMAYQTQQPGYTPSNYYEDKLWGLADKIESSFLSARPDIGIDELKRRFDVDSNSALTVTDVRSWGYDKRDFRVKTYDLANQSMIGVMAMTNTPALLRTYFTSTGIGQGVTVLYAREETFRAAAQTRDGQIRDNQEVFNLSDSAVPSQTTATLNWAPFLYKGAGIWEPFALDPYLEYLHVRVGPSVQTDAELNSSAYAFAGSLMAVDGLYAARYNGTSIVASAAGKALTTPLAKTDADLKALSGNIGTGGSAVSALIKEVAMQESFINWAAKTGTAASWTSTYLEKVGMGKFGSNLGGNIAKAKDFFAAKNMTKTRKATIAVAGVVVVGLVIGHFVGQSYSSTLTSKIEGILTSGVMAGMAAYSAYSAVKGASVAYKARNLALGTGMKAAKQFMSKLQKVTLAVGLVVAVGAGVAMFFAESANASFGSKQYDQAIVNLVATIIVAVIMVAIALIPGIGQAILAVVALLDAVADLICKAMGIEADPNGNGAKDWLCNGLTGLLTKAVGAFIFSSNPIVNMDDDKRREISSLIQTLKDPSKGFQQGNEVKVSFNITSSIVPNHPNSWMAHIYSDHYGSYYMKQTAVKYELQTVTTSLHSDLYTDNKPANYWPYFNAATGRAYTKRTVSINIPLTRPGLNQVTSASIAEGFAINLQKCVFFLISFACWLQDKKDTNFIPVDDLEYDVFPPTLDQFYTLIDRGNNSFALAWDQRFPTLCDADGDGLRSKACNGGDPDDLSPDHDRDGLSDFDEVTQYRTDPLSRDTDGDGLSDYQEALAKTNPLQADSDGDGLFDCEEVLHRVLTPDPGGICGESGAWSPAGWSFIYGFDTDNRPLRTWVVPRPDSVDSDGDSFLDNKEKIYGFNPRVLSRSDILGISAEVYENGALSDGYVRPGQTFTYTARLQNYLNDRFAQGLLEVSFTASLTSANLPPKSFVLMPRQTTTLPGSLTVSPLITQTQQLTLTNRAGAEIVDVYGQRSGQKLWMHFDEPFGATRFIDSSSPSKSDSTCYNVCPNSVGNGYLSRGLRFGGTFGQAVVLPRAAELGLKNHDVYSRNASFSVVVWVSVTQHSADITDAPSLILFSPGIAGAPALILRNGQPAIRPAYGSSSAYDLIAPTTLSTQQWHQLIFRYDDVLGQHAIYVDGRQEVLTTTMPALNIASIGPPIAGRLLNGSMDELEIFNRALTDAEIGARAAAPILHFKFDGDFKDASASGLGPVRMEGLNLCGVFGCYDRYPTVGPDGVMGGALTFANWVSDPWSTWNTASTNDGYSVNQTMLLPSSVSLDMSVGRWTQAFWIYPNVSSYMSYDHYAYGVQRTPQNRRIGVLGATSLASGNFPFVELVGPTDAENAAGATQLRLRVGYSKACFVETQQLLSDQQWRHIVVSYDKPSYSIYSNGVLVASLTLPLGCSAPSSADIYYTSDLLLGRSSERINRGLPRKAVLYEKTNFTGKAVTITTDVPIWIQAGRVVTQAKSIQLINTCLTVYTLDQWLGSSEELCSNVTDINFGHVAIANNIHALEFSQKARSFNGKLDDVRLYREPLGPFDAVDLFNMAARRIELNFDEAPGATKIRDSSFGANTVLCAPGACPTTGLPGRVNQAALFDGVNDVLQLRTGAVMTVSGAGAAVSTWIKTSSSATQVIMEQRGQSPIARAYYLETVGGKARLRGYLDTGVSFAVTSTSFVNDNEWHHVLAVMGTTQAFMYVDGAQEGWTPHAEGTIPTTLFGSTVVGAWVGGDPNDGTNYFKGLIDTLILWNTFPDNTQIAAMIGEAPALNLHLDDDSGSRVFADTTRLRLDGGCFGATCPQPGVAGVVRGGAFFDGVDDGITVPNANPLNLRAYSIATWVRPEQIRNRRQTLINKGSSAESCSQSQLDQTRNYYLGLQPYTTTVRFLAGKDTASPGLAPAACPTSGPLLFDLISTNGLNLSQWNHVVGTFDGSFAKLYVNGVLDRNISTTIGLIPTRNNSALEIGKVYNGTWDDVPFTGRIDEVAVYSSALSARAIKQMHDYQDAWFDFSAGTRMVIDADAPAVAIDLNVARMKSAPDTVMCILASDATSAIQYVEYSDDGATWKRPTLGPGDALSRTIRARTDNGNCFITTLVSTAGLKSVRARAVDGVGNMSAPVTTTFTVDAAGPAVALALSLQTGVRAPIGNAVALSGTVSDTDGGAVGSVTAALIAETGAATRGAVTATFGAGTWQEIYPLGFTPHGVYTVALRAADGVGNVTLRATDRISIDGFGPLADLTFSGPSTRSIAGTGASLPGIAGTVADVPYPSNALLHLHFEEPSSAPVYADASIQRHDAVCAGACAQAPGMLGKAVQLDNSDALVVADPLDVYKPVSLTGYTLAVWVKPDSAAGANLIARAASVSGAIPYQVRINAAGEFEHDAFDGISRVITSTTTVVPGTWYHVAGVADSDGQMRLFVNGIQEGRAITLSTVQTGGDQYRLGGLTAGAAGYYAGLLDEALVYGRALRADEVFAIARPTASGSQSVEVGLQHARDEGNSAAITWYPAALAQPGQLFSTWSFSLPEGIEGPYDIALRATDGLGNVRTALAAWSGEIDTWAPRVLLTTTIEGGRVRYTTTAQDFNLAAEGFNSACGMEKTNSREYFAADWYSAAISPTKGVISVPDQDTLRGKIYSLGASCLLNAPPSMAEVGVVKGPYATALAASGNTLYAASDGLRVLAYDISNPDKPALAGELALATGGRLVVTGSLLLNSAANILNVLSIASPNQPSALGVYTLTTPSFIRGVAVAGRYAYLGAAQAGLRVIDLIDPAAPAEIGMLNTISYAYGLAVSGTYAYVADMFRGLRIVNIANPAAPVEVGHYDLGTSPRDVAVSGHFAYLGTERGLTIIDVSNPAVPALVATRDLPAMSVRVSISGTDVSMAMVGAGVVLIDVSDPAAPLISRVFDTPGLAMDTLARGARIYVADHSGGLGVLNTLLRPASIAYDEAGNATRLTLPALTKAQLAQLTANPDAPTAGSDTLSLQIDLLPPLLNGAPYTLTGLVASLDGGSLRTLSATIDGALIYTQSWTPGAALATAWSGAWTPAGEGAHIVTLRAVDWVDASAEETTTLYVDTLAPALSLSVTQIGPNQVGVLGDVDLRGAVSDSSGIREVRLRVAGTDLVATLDGAGGWTARWNTGLATPPDGLSAPVAITATDAVGRMTSLASALTLDSVPPAPFVVSMSYTNSLGARVALMPGQTIYDVLTPTLLLSWPAVADGGGIDHYQAGWTAAFTLTAPEQAGLALTPASDLANAQAVGEARKVYAHVVASDLLGNQTASVAGPVYVDYRRTNDYVPLDDIEGVYRGWQLSGCSLLGTDLRISRALPSTAPLGVPQSLYASWNASALRLVWTGADWDADGDLFVYLAGPGPSTTIAYNPVSPAMAITLPLQATRLVWVRGNTDYSFLIWDGATWMETAWPEIGFGFSPDLAAPTTDLLLPFAALGVTSPATTTLGLLALAVESSADGLRTWATLPRRNPLNAARVVGASESLAHAGGGYGAPTRAFALALGADRCPQDDVYSGADPAMTIAANPAGRISTVFEDGWTVTDGNPQSALIGSGDPIVYRFDIINRGGGAAMNASIVLTGDQVNLGNAQVGDHVWRMTVALGDLAAGATRTVTVSGSVDLAAGAARGNFVRLDSSLVFSHSEYAGEALVRQRAEHAADISPPTHLKLLPGSGLAGAGGQTIRGIVHDAGSVPTITLEVQPPGGSPATLDCPAALPDGAWECAWNAGPSPVNDTVFQLRARATDRYGNTSPWTGLTDLVVDTQPVTLSLDAATIAALADGNLSPEEAILSGRVDDNHAVSRVDICDGTGQSCQPLSLLPDAATTQETYLYDDRPTEAITFSAPLGCVIGAPLTRAFVVTDAFVLANVGLGLNASLPARAGLSATLRSPAGTLVALHAPGGGGGRDLDVLWNDAGPIPLDADGADQSTDAPDYDNARYPDGALSAFDGQSSAGVWTLSLCDTLAQTGTYNHARLILEGRPVTANGGASWAQALALPASADGISGTHVLYGYDSLGNRAGPLTITYSLDTIAPVLTVTALSATLAFTLGADAVAVITGTVLDGGRVRNVFVTIQDPAGETTAANTTFAPPALVDRPEAGLAWSYALQPNQSGVYALSITALDDAGNSATIGPFNVLVNAVAAPVLSISYAFLPNITRGAPPPAPMPENQTSQNGGSHE